MNALCSGATWSSLLELHKRNVIIYTSKSLVGTRVRYGFRPERASVGTLFVTVLDQRGPGALKLIWAQRILGKTRPKAADFLV